MAQEFVISVLTPDRVGLIAGMTQAVCEAGGNIVALSETVLQGYFSVIATAALPDACTPEHLQRAIEATGRAGELAVLVRRRQAPAAARATAPGSDTFIMTVSGADQPGFLARISAYLASRGINIEDLSAHTDHDRFLVMGELVLPAREDVRQVQIDLEALLPPGERVVALHHANVFAATNEIAFRHTKRSTP